MIVSLKNHKRLPRRNVLVDNWYAIEKLIQLIEDTGKIYYCPFKKNRLVDDTGGVEKYKAIEKLIWNQNETQQGQIMLKP
ncbi:hypothetical protein [Scytonema sp. PCC 10023]|uniref:hypothetical protein n=1 Tax=Scytonema sp. PCC 10023 TaxID=1680591 RepID=UPI0039C70370